MVFACHRCIVATTALLFFCSLPSGAIAATGTITSNISSPSPNSSATCEFRTINYITNTLPQLCLRSSWSSTDAAEATKTVATNERGTPGGNSTTDSISITATINDSGSQPTADGGVAGEKIQTGGINHSSTASASSESASATTTPPDESEEGELNDASFLSFEDWKKQTLEKAGQQNLDIGKKRSSEPTRRREAESFQNNLESLGDDGEIDLDFGAFRNGVKPEQTSQTSDDREPGPSQEPREEQDAPKRGRDQYRSKDAGVTCKERFSYASFDAGATILKTHPGAKNSKAVLIENKDSYMLSECKTENKFLIIELSVGLPLKY